MNAQTVTRSTVLVTGSSTGIGRSAVLRFQAAGWNVIATMRTPSKETELQKLANVSVVALDVTQPDSIKAAFAEGVKLYGRIDAVVNNAGYGLTGPFESTDLDQIRKQFETNVFGLMEVTRHAIPVLRAQGGGNIVNVSSVGGRVTFPLYSIYHASKWAVEGFTEGLGYELKGFGIRMKLVEPGTVKTDFYDRSRDSSFESAPPEYRAMVEAGTKNMDTMAMTSGSTPEKVADTILKAASDRGSKLRYPVGQDAHLQIALHNLLPVSAYQGLIGKIVFRGIKN